MSASESSRFDASTAVSITEAVRKVSGVEAGIKWPNDILVDGKKLAGIITEMTAEMNVVRYVILGIGLNVNVNTSEFPHDLLMPATSLKEETGRPVDLEKILKACLNNLVRDYAKLADGFEDVLARWTTLSVVIGKKVKVSQPDRRLRGRQSVFAPTERWRSSTPMVSLMLSTPAI